MGTKELKELLNERYQNKNAEIVIPKEVLFMYIDMIEDDEENPFKEDPK